MLLVIAIATYVTIGMLIPACLLTDKSAYPTKLDVFFFFLIIPVWPLAVGFAAGWGLWDNIKERINTRQKERKSALIRFSSKLVKIGLISMNAHLELQRALNEKYGW